MLFAVASAYSVALSNGTPAWMVNKHPEGNTAAPFAKVCFVNQEDSKLTLAMRSLRSLSSYRRQLRDERFSCSKRAGHRRGSPYEVGDGKDGGSGASIFKAVAGSKLERLLGPAAAVRPSAWSRSVCDW